MKITIDNADIKIKDGIVTIDIDSAKLDNSDIGKVKLSTLKPGDEFGLGNKVFIVLEHTDVGTRVISKEFAYFDMKFGNCNDWTKSTIRNKFLGQEYYEKICDIIGKDNIIPMKRDLTSLDGLDDFGFCIDVVSLLTVTEYAKYHKILGLKTNYPNWWWLITPASTPSNNDTGSVCTGSVCCVRDGGALDYFDCNFGYGVRPFLTLKSSIFVL